MSRKRTTVKIVDLVDQINTALRESPPEWKEARLALSVVADKVLIDANQYKGFRYLPTEWDGSKLKEGYDDTRREYYVYHLKSDLS